MSSPNFTNTISGISMLPSHHHKRQHYFPTPPPTPPSPPHSATQRINPHIMYEPKKYSSQGGRSWFIPCVDAGATDGTLLHSDRCVIIVLILQITLLEHIYSFFRCRDLSHHHLSYPPLHIVSLVSTSLSNLLVRVGSANSMTHLRIFFLRCRGRC